MKANQWGITAIVPLTNNFFGLCVIGSPLYVWDQEKEQLNELVGHNGSVRCIASHENGIFASGSNDTTIRIWNSETLKCVCILTGHRQYVECVAFINGRLVSGSYDGIIRIWDKKSYQCLAEIPTEQGDVQTLATMEDGTLISGHFNGMVRSWKEG